MGERRQETENERQNTENRFSDVGEFVNFKERLLIIENINLQ